MNSRRFATELIALAILGVLLALGWAAWTTHNAAESVTRGSR